LAPLAYTETAGKPETMSVLCDYFVSLRRLRTAEFRRALERHCLHQVVSQNKDPYVTVLQLIIIKESGDNSQLLLEEMCKLARRVDKMGVFFEGSSLAMTLEKGWAKRFLHDTVDIFMKQYVYDGSARNFFCEVVSSMNPQEAVLLMNKICKDFQREEKWVEAAMVFECASDLRKALMAEFPVKSRPQPTSECMRQAVRVIFDKERYYRRRPLVDPDDDIVCREVGQR
jgi:hypothetical protein